MEVGTLKTNNVFETRKNKKNYDTLIKAVSDGCLFTINLLKETTPDLQLNGTM